MTNGERMYGARRHLGLKVEVNWFFIGNSSACQIELEPYAKAHIPLAAHRVLAGLWAGCLPLQVELGRFTCPKTPYKQWLCKSVVKLRSEDQTHFLLMCPKLREPRVALFKSVSVKYQNFVTEPTSKKLSILLHPQEHVYCITMGIYNCIHIDKNWYLISDHCVFPFCSVHTLHTYTYLSPHS